MTQPKVVKLEIKYDGQKDNLLRIDIQVDGWPLLSDYFKIENDISCLHTLANFRAHLEGIEQQLRKGPPDALADR